MIELKPLSGFSFAEAAALWNEGFKGYAVDMTMSMDDYVSRLHNSGVSTDKSLVATTDGRAVGFLLNAIRNHSGEIVAWNAGTGVIPEFRGRGVGRVLVEGALRIYAGEKVDYATLEAISTNAPAIALYKSCGYEAIGELTFLQNEGVLDFLSRASGYTVQEVPTSWVSRIKFYDAFVPWQAHWQILNDNRGQGLIVYDSQGSTVGYALFRRQYDEHGDVKTITLHDCVADPSTADAETIVSTALSHVFLPLSADCRRSTHNFKKSNEVVMNMLHQAGFTTLIEQVWMRR